MANVKINDLALAGGVSDTMQLETDIGGATENKITIAQLSDKIIDTDLGLTTTVANAVQTTNATTDGLAESTTVLTAPAANQFQLTNGTSDLLVTADCTIDQDLSTTADVTFNSVNMVNAINEFSTDGTMAGDSDSAVPTEKAVKIYGETLSSVDKPKYETLSIGSASLTAISSYLYLYTSSVKTVFLPNATTLVNGQAFIISNNGTYNTPILLSDSSTLFTLNAGETIRIVCIDNGTTNGSWNIIDKITTLLERAGTTISPANAGDDLDMGTGGITATAVILDAQGSAPSTTDGTIYYNSSSTDFQFRENGSWVTIGTTNVWQRVSTTISPVTAGDDLDMGTGDIDAANVDVTGNYKIGTDRVLAIDASDRAQLFVGYHAGINTEINGDAYRNTAVGHDALKTNIKGDYNTAVGFSSLSLNANDADGLNTAIGAYSLWQATGAGNTGLGSYVGYNQSGGNNNVLIGSYAGNGGPSGTYAKSNNTMIGYASGNNCLTGDGNIFLGYMAGFNETGSNKLYIENSNSATPLIYGEFDTNLVKINGTFQSTGNATIGVGAAGVDYTLTFDGETNDGVITWLEDEDIFNMSGGITTTGEIVGGDLTITGSTPQLKFNDSDDDVFIIATEGGDDLHFYNNIADHNAAFKFFTKTGDGTDLLSMQLYGVGTSAATSPSERLHIEYQSSLFKIYTNAGGGGTDRNLQISAGTDTDQLLLDTSGNVSMSGELSVSEKIGAGTSDIIYPLQANAESTTLAVPLLIENQEGGVTSATGIRFKAVDDTTDIRAKAAIFFERTDAGGVGSLHLAVEGTNDDSNVDLTDARLTIDSSGDVSMSGSLDVTGAITLQVDTTDVSNPPTDAQLDSAFGTPATVGAGWTTYLNDNGAGSNFYQIVSDGTNWWISTFTKAV